MSKIPRHIVDQIRESTDIAELIGRHVRLERRGNSLVGLCPFHQEKSPSFNVVPHKAMYHCFGCGKGGDAFRFLMELEGLSFVEAVKELGAAAGIAVPERDLTPEERRALKLKATLYDVMDEAASFYESVLWTRPEGEPGRQYLEKRALTMETARKARVGYAPAGWSNLLDHLRRQGFDARLALESGIVRERRGGDGYYDYFRERIIFPIRDEKGRVIAFGGRTLGGDEPKYLNTPETQLYQKSHVLYGLDLARQAIQQRDRAIMVEGYFDVLALFQAGFQEAVATCGTSVTEEHLEKLRRLTSNVIVTLDSDQAGARAAERVLPMFLKASVQAWRLELPGAKDPDELIREHGPEAMKQALEHKNPLLDWFIERKLESRGHNAVGRQRTLAELLPLLATFPHGVLSQVAARLHTPESSVLEQVRSYQRSRPVEERDPHLTATYPAPSAWKPNRDHVHVLWLLVHRYDQVADLVARMDPALLGEYEPLRSIVARLLTGEPVAGVLPEIIDPEIKKVVLAVVARTELYTEDQAALGMCELIERLATGPREVRLASLTRQMEEALRNGDTATHRAAGAERAMLLADKKEFKQLLLAHDIEGFMARLCRDAVVAPVQTSS